MSSTSMGQLWDRLTPPTCHFRSCIGNRGLKSAACYFSDDPVWVLLDVAAWCCTAERIKVDMIKSKIAALQHFHRGEVGTEFPANSPL